MPFLKRSEIIERYGFDPLSDKPKGGVTVVERAEEGPSAPITVTEDPKPAVDPTEKTSGVGANMLAGAMKSFGSDPLAIYGLGAGILDYAISNLTDAKGKTFAESMYQEGGIQRVQQHLQSYADSIKARHPEYNREQILQEVDKYRSTSKDFYLFNADQMRTGLSLAMKNELAANEIAGMNKLPSQESIPDALMQIATGVAIPNPIGAIAKLGTSALSRGVGTAAGKAINILDTLAMPGTDIAAYSAPRVAAGTAVGAAVDQGVRYAADQPNVFEGAQLIPEASKYTDRIPGGSPIPMDPMVQPPQETPPPPPDTIADTATAIGAASTLGIMGYGGRRAIRSFVPQITPNYNPNRVQGGNVDIGGGPSIQQQTDDIARNRGFQLEEERPRTDVVAEAIDTAIDSQAAPGRLGRDLGGIDLKEQTDAVVTTLVSPSARENSVNNYISHGTMPDGFRGTRPEELFVMAQQMPRQDVEVFARGLLSEEHRFMRSRTEAAVQERLAQAVQRNDQPAIQEQTARLARVQADDPRSRYSATNLSRQELDASIMEMQNNPNAMALRNTLARLNTDIINLKERAGIIGRDTAIEQRQRPSFTSLFENNKGLLRGWMADASKNTGAFDPGRARDTGDFDFDDPDRIAVNNSIDPFQSFSVRAANAVSYASYVVGAKQILRQLRTADPQGRQVQYLGYVERPPAGAYTVQLPVNGRMHTWQFARKSVADAFNQSPMDMGTMLGFFNKSRQIFQEFTTGAYSPASVGVAMRSLGMDVAAGLTLRPANRSFGVLGSITRRLLGNTGIARVLGPIADQFDVMTFNAAYTQVPIAIMNSVVWKTQGLIGRQMMEAALGKFNVWRTVAALPGGEQFLRDMGERIYRSMENTPIGMMRRYNVYNVHSMVSDSFGAQVRYNNMLRDYEMGGRNQSLVVQQALRIRDTVRSFLSSIADAGKIAYFAQNYAGLERRYGIGRVPSNEVRRLAYEAHSIGGNMTASPSNPILQRAGATLPYMNLAMQATRYMVNSAFNGGTERSINVAMRLGSLTMALFAGLKLIEQSGMNDWFYENIPEHERVGKWWMPTAKWFQRFIEEGEYPKLDPSKDNFREYFDSGVITPELTMLTTPMLVGMEHFGMLTRGSNSGQTTGSSDLLQSVGNVLGPGTTPFLGVYGALTGQKLQAPPFKLFDQYTGRAQSSEIRPPRGMGIETGNLPSGIPVWASEITRSIIGTTGAIAIQALDAGLQANKQGKDLAEASDIFLNEVQQEVANRTPIPGMWNVEEKLYATPISKKINEQAKMMEALDLQWQNEFSPSTQRFPNRPRIQDPQVKQMVAISHAFFEQGGYPKIQEYVSDIRKQIEAVDSQKGTMSRDQRFARKQQLTNKLRNVQEKQDDMIHRFNRLISKKYGPRFKQEGVEPTLEGIISLTQKYTQ